MSRRTSALILASLLGAACAEIFGLDEPTVAGAGSTASAASSSGVSTSSSTGETSSGDTTSAGGSGSGGGGGEGGSTSSQGGGGGSTVECTEHVQCDDDNPCTVTGCIEGRCSVEPARSDPVDDPEDCVRVTCNGTVATTEVDEDDDPADANPPCELRVCEGGRVVPELARNGISCGPAPLSCEDGVCVGCDADSDCGGATFCSTPDCTVDATCDPGFLPADTVLPDPLDGDCQIPRCTGSAVDAISVDDDSDLPADGTCSIGTCQSGAPVSQPAPVGTPCAQGSGSAGFCNGTGTGTAACGECSEASHCFGNPLGDECILGTCGCMGATGCTPSLEDYGSICIGGACGCNNDFDCSNNARGTSCHAQLDRCQCENPTDCQNSDWGSECILDPAGRHCGCDGPGDCDGSDTCDLTLDHCVP